jgi:hypothetical protein
MAGDWPAAMVAHTTAAVPAAAVLNVFRIRSPMAAILSSIEVTTRIDGANRAGPPEPDGRTMSFDTCPIAG